jgi:hypothetical protein
MNTKLLSIACAALVATTGFSHAGFVGVRAGPVAVGVRFGGGPFWGPGYAYGPFGGPNWGPGYAYGPRYYRPWYGPRIAARPVVLRSRVVAARQVGVRHRVAARQVGMRHRVAARPVGMRRAWAR